jgi:hypothetical protein
MMAGHVSGGSVGGMEPRSKNSRQWFESGREHYKQEWHLMFIVNTCQRQASGR